MTRDAAWAAGLFEGEGTISPRSGSKGPKHLWQMTLSSTDEDVIHAFREVVGIGKIYGPYGYVNDTNRRRDHHKPYWRWVVSSRKEVEEFAALIRPYLLSRRQGRLDECLAAINNPPPDRRRRSKEATQ